MAISYLAKINGTTLPKVNIFKVVPNKLWVEANRNLAGDLKATLVGEFDKITIGFSYLTGAELSTVMQLLDVASFSLEFYDPKTQLTRTATFYAGDYEPELHSKTNDIWKPFTVNLIPYKKRT